MSRPELTVLDIDERRSVLGSLYHRYREAYVTATVVAAWVAAIATATVFAALAGRLTGIGAVETVRAALILLAYQVGVVAIMSWHIRGDIRTLRRWASPAGKRDAGTRRRTLTVALGLPRRTVLAALPYLTPGPLLTGLIFGFDEGEFHLANAIGTAAGAVIVILYAATVAYQSIEFLLRPLRLELGQAVTSDEVAAMRSASVTMKILIGAGTAALVLGFLTAAVAAPTRDWDQAWTIVLVIFLASGTVGLSMALLLARNALAPVGDLARGTQEVARGNLEVSIPVTSTDELGELAASFNEMVEGLREREALRGENVGLVEELRASRARIVAASDAARQHVERDLHDGAQQNLVLLNLKLGQLERAAAGDAELQELVVESRTELGRALGELRDLAHGIYPQILTSDGLAAALTEASANSAIPVTIDGDGTGRYAPEIEAAAYFCCLEALQNASKHAGEGATARVTLSENAGELRFEVVDDGAGFDRGATDGSAGLQNMADRIGALGGRMQIESRPGQGTRVSGSVPVSIGR